MEIRAADLGIDTWRARQLGPLQVVDVRQFSGHFALAFAPSRRGRVWVTMSLCHVRAFLISRMVHLISHELCMAQDSQEPDRVDQIEDPDDY